MFAGEGRGVQVEEDADAAGGVRRRAQHQLPQNIQTRGIRHARLSTVIFCFNK